MIGKDFGSDSSIWSPLRVGGNNHRQVKVDAKLAEGVDVVAECARLHVVNDLEVTVLDIDDEQGGLGAVDPGVVEIGRGG